jgi:hypothetical protein
VADLEQIIGVSEHERPVGQVGHVELDDVATQLGRPGEGT